MRSVRRKEARLKAYEAEELAEVPETDLSVAAKEGNATKAKAKFDSLYKQAQLAYPKREFSINVFRASTGSLNYSIQEEGRSSALTDRGNGVPSIRDQEPDGELRTLNGPERRNIGPQAQEIFNAEGSKVMSKHVELQVQLYVAELPNAKVLWRIPGAGGPKGLRPYKVEVRLFPHNADGTVPNGYIHML